MKEDPMKKTFIIDTSILLYDLESIFKFENNEVIIPSIVMEELDSFKEESSERGYAARRVLEILEDLSKVRPLQKGVTLKEIPTCSPFYELAKEKQTLIKKSYQLENKDIDGSIVHKNNDSKIIACAKSHKGILVSRDRSMRILARDFVEVEDYRADQIKVRELYKGYRREKVSEDVIAQMYSGVLEDTFGLYPNEFIILENIENPKHTGVGIKKKEGIISIDFKNPKMKTKPLNLEQKMLLYLLNDPDILCVTVTGVSGKGKSLLATDYALSRVEDQSYLKLLYTKSATPLDKNEYLGFTKGDMDDKMKPHLQPLYSSIEFLYKNALYDQNKGKIGVDAMVDKLIADDVLNFCPLANIRGMSIFNKVLILDEAQNTTNHTVKSLVTRMTDSSKLIVLGDVEQIDDRNLNKYNNGLSHLIEAGKSEPFIGHLCMDISEGSRRGLLSDFGANKL